jgi:hypothetical protein
MDGENDLSLLKPTSHPTLRKTLAKLAINREWLRRCDRMFVTGATSMNYRSPCICAGSELRALKSQRSTALIVPSSHRFPHLLTGQRPSAHFGEPTVSAADPLGKLGSPLLPLDFEVGLHAPFQDLAQRSSVESPLSTAPSLQSTTALHGAECRPQRAGERRRRVH